MTGREEGNGENAKDGTLKVIKCDRGRDAKDIYVVMTLRTKWLMRGRLIWLPEGINGVPFPHDNT